MTTPTDPAPTYRARQSRFAAERDALTQRWERLADLRLAAGALALVLLGAWLLRGRPPWLLLPAVLLFAAFALLVARHARLGRARRRAALLADLNAEALARLARAWDALPLRHTFRAPPNHPFAADLDLFGPASLAHLLDVPKTPLAEATLRAWLIAPAPPDTVRERQAAVADLAPRLDLRQDLARHALESGPDRRPPEPFLAWAEGEPWLARRPALRWAAVASPALLALGVAAQALGLTALPLWLPPLLVNVVLVRRYGAAAHAILEDAASQRRALTQDAAAIDLLTAAPLAAPLLTRLRAALGASDRPAGDQIRRFDRIATYVIPPDSLSLTILQNLVLWDVHVLAAMERWRAEAGPRVRGWLAALAEAEALAALAGLAHDDPAWTYPDLDPTAASFEATALGHPLLPDAARVANDVTVGPAGTFLLVTGSNMSGKSTLLRALGVNAVLAGAGAPVCAAALRLPPVDLWTSVHVEDSLARGVSYFMAELQRLKAVVDAARQDHAAKSDPNSNSNSNPTFLYLLDEILTGTNTAERQIAARRIVAHLVALGALGAVSTHDLALADTPALAASARPIHFRETVAPGPDGRAAMTFDYRARPGIATSSNALRLMALVGLDLPDPNASDETRDARGAGEGIATPARPPHAKDEIPEPRE